MSPNDVAPPIESAEGLLFTLSEVTFAPLAPRMHEPFTVTGKIDLFRLRFIGPIWIIATVLYPERWWEEIIPIIGSPEVRKDATALGGDFKVTFPQGFDREGEFTLTVRAYAGPTMPIDSITLPPFPPVSTAETVFEVTGEVPEEETAFSLTKPTINPTDPVPGTEITISCPVTSEATKAQDISVKCIIYEGSLLPGHGTKLAEYTSDVMTIEPGATNNFNFLHTTVAGSIDRRDVEVEVYIGSNIVKQSEWDDVYYVKVSELELLEVKIDPPGAGIITTDPAPSEGTENNWLFPHGTIVNVTAHPATGYAFGSWSGEMTDSSSPTAPVSPLTEKRTITAHFTQEGEEPVTPPKADIRNFDFKALEGTYSIGEQVPFTALFDYIGKAQSGRLTIYLGTGVYPTFYTKYAFDPITISFNKSMNWQSFAITGKITLPPSLEPGQTYSVQAKLEATSDFTQEIDTDWGAIKVSEAPATYTLTVSASPTGAGIVTISPNKTKYLPGERVTLTASPASGHEFDHWGGDASGTSPSTSVTMDKDRFIVAVFREVAPPTGIDCSVLLISIPSWLIPVSEWYITWRGIEHGKWTGVSYSITLEDILATGAMTAVLKTSKGTYSFTTQTYTLVDGRTYRFNVEYLRLE